MAIIKTQNQHKLRSTLENANRCKLKFFVRNN